MNKTKFIEGKMKKISGVLDILVCLLLFISSLYKGAFYKEDALFINMIICLLGLVCLSVKLVANIVDNKKIVKSKIGTIVDSLVVFMPIAYFFPVLFGTYASMENAIFESIRYVNFAIIYFIVRTTSNKKVYLTSIMLIGIILAILGIDEITYRCFENVLKPLSINYISSSGKVISSTLQYANVTALIMLISNIILQSKVIKNITKIKDGVGIKFKILVSIELFSLILLQSAIVLTTSRMNILLMIIASFIYFVVCIKNKEKKEALAIILFLLAAFVLVASIDSYLLIQNNLMIWVTYLITLVLIVSAVFLNSIFNKNSCKITRNINNKLDIKKIIILIVAIISVLFILNIKCKLTLEDSTGSGNIVTRNIYCDFKNTMNVDIDLDFERNDNFQLDIYEIKEDLSKKLVLSITKLSVKDGKYNGIINLNNNVKKLQLEFKTIDSRVSINSLKLNDENIALSYMFMPDTIMFRLKDTFVEDTNNSLRLTYYKDALKLFNTSKLIGIGGEGFKARYQEVQTKAYISSETHSAPLQILVESGIIGFITFLGICVFLVIIVLNLLKNKSEDGFSYFLIVLIFLITSAFDIVFSYGIMINIFGIITGLVIGEYKKEYILEKDKYELDNKSTLGMVKIAVLSVSLMVLFVATIYSINIYKASMIVLQEIENDLSISYERVGRLEQKLKLDKYNLAYLNSLLTEYDRHIDIINSIYIASTDEQERSLLKQEANNYIVKQKEVADSIVEYEYYNKYALDKVARCYLKHYISYSNIYNKNFKTDEIAYVFYLGYAIKLTDRITEIGSANKVAHDLAYNIYNEYLPALKKQNVIIGSEMLKELIQDMEYKLDALK